MDPPRAQDINPTCPDSNPRQLVSSLITSISAPRNSQNPLKEVTSEGKNLFLTLYALFEKETLPALDCLDRGLVIRLNLSPGDERSLFLVRSAQQHHTRYGTFENINHYEVRLDAWSCSCPAFAFSAFPAQESSKTENSHPPDGTWLFGGLSRGSDLPVCKHILACTLVKHCEGFEGFVEDREISREEFAGWAAGWGD